MYFAALYMRLSREEGGKESRGVESQRLLLRAYAAERGFEVYDEYVDDGYSGTRYDRPAFARMLADIEAGKVNLVMVKDLSRLGRNYIASGELTEVYFPEKQVRLIAVNDGYDSERGEDDMAPFRHVINEMYARDISRKIRSALYAKMRDGQYIGSFAPYGYRKCADNKNRLEPDEAAAKIVRDVFCYAGAGASSSEIAKILNQNGVSVPLDYRREQRGLPSENRLWTPSGVCKILRNQIYLGNTVQGKNVKHSLKSRISRPVKKENWIVVKHTHLPLVTEAEFAAAQQRIGKRDGKNSPFPFS